MGELANLSKLQTYTPLVQRGFIYRPDATTINAESRRHHEPLQPYKSVNPKMHTMYTTHLNLRRTHPTSEAVIYMNAVSALINPTAKKKRAAYGAMCPVYRQYIVCQPYIHIYIYTNLYALSLAIYIYISPINLYTHIYIYVHLYYFKSLSLYIHTPPSCSKHFLHIRIPYQILGTDPIQLYIDLKPKLQTLKCPEPKLQSAVNVDDTCVWGEAQR